MGNTYKYMFGTNNAPVKCLLIVGHCILITWSYVWLIKWCVLYMNGSWKMCKQKKVVWVIYRCVFNKTNLLPGDINMSIKFLRGPWMYNKPTIIPAKWPVNRNTFINKNQNKQGLKRTLFNRPRQYNIQIFDRCIKPPIKNPQVI